MENTKFAFFGTSRFSVILLEEMKKFGIIPELIITAADKPVGRKQIMTPPPVKDWAVKNSIKTLQPKSLKDEDFKKELEGFPFFIVASYGKIIPQSILDIPVKGAINIHPSLLPKYRGPAPIQNQILNNEENVGTSVMLMDAEMDHGPIIIQKKVELTEAEFPAPYNSVEEKLAIESAALLNEILGKWLNKEIEPKEQDHSSATYTKMIEKLDGEISLSDDPMKNWLKYLAYSEWPKTFFFEEHDGKKIRNIITSAELTDGKFVVKKIIPEGKTERRL